MTPDQLRAARVKLNLTQQALATLLGVPANTLARWERGVMAIQQPHLLRLAIEHLSCRRKR